jgi:hypothetical protein
MRIFSGSAVVGAALLGFVALPGASNAAVLIETGPGNFFGDSNVVFNPCTSPVFGPALQVSGCLNADHDYGVHFLGEQNLIADGGQALVKAEVGGFEFLEIFADTDFATLITFINASDFLVGQPQTGQVHITPFIGGVAQLTQTFDLSETGLNQFRISTDDGSLISSIQFRTQDAFMDGVVFDDFRQTRLGTGDPFPVPTPGTLSLFLAGLVALGVGAFNTRRRRLTAA